MDPNKAWADAQDESLSDDERLDAIEALWGWLGKGGFEPADYDDEACKVIFLAALARTNGEG
jgi:hypothetical protein